MNNSIAQISFDFDALIDASVQKRCTKCNELKPLDQFSQRGDKKGLRSWCKQCRNDESREKTLLRQQSRVQESLDSLEYALPTPDLLDLPISVSAHRRCRRCKETKSINDFYLKSNGQVASPDCKDCFNAKKRESHRRRKHPGLLPSEPEGSRTHKECNKCHQLLPFDCFDFASRNKDGLRGSCRSCNKIVVEEKRCKTCLYVLPASEFDREPLTKDQLTSSCRKCRSELALKNRPLEKECTKCHRILPFTDFGSDPRGRHGLKAQCRACHRLHDAKSRTPEKRAEEHLYVGRGKTPVFQAGDESAVPFVGLGHRGIRFVKKCSFYPSSLRTCVY